MGDTQSLEEELGSERGEDGKVDKMERLREQEYVKLRNYVYRISVNRKETKDKTSENAG